MPAPRAAYVHVPFCRHRCGYCNFTLVAGRDDFIERYLEALERELAGLERPRPVETLFIGGGTPTHLAPPALERLLASVNRWFPLADGAEFSVEANPCDISEEKVAVLRQAGVTRLSLGAQSFQDRKLALLERDHRAEQIEAAVRLARDGFASVALDLIFGVPGETIDQWRLDLERAIELYVDHVSTYGLTFERGTRFWSQRLKGALVELDDEMWRSMYALAIDRLAAAGFEHYEVSNFARSGRRCRHNEVYWAGEQYFAAGPGAARHVAGRREVNHRSTTTYIARVLAGQSPVAESETLSAEDRARERLVIGLRRIEGVDVGRFADQTGFDIHALAGRELQRHLELRTLELHGDRLRLTREGLFVSDAIWPDFLRA